MKTVYDKSGRKTIIQHEVDVVSALRSGNYFLENPVKTKVEVVHDIPKKAAEAITREAVIKEVEEMKAASKIDQQASVKRKAE